MIKVLVFILILSPFTMAQDYQLNDIVIESVEVNTDHATRIKAHKLNPSQRQSLVRALENQQGVDTQVSCAFCGSKRVTINGHRGEHTSILVDGLSLTSTVSSFYGVDAIPVSGISSIDVYRGAGNSYTLPESLAGTLAIHTQSIEYTQSDFSVFLNQRLDSTLNLFHSQRISEEFGFLIGVQGLKNQAWDIDQNLIAELPDQDSLTSFSKFQWRPNPTSEVFVRHSYGQVKTRGGHLKAQELASVPNPLVTFDNFENGDIRHPFIGSPNQIRDLVKLDRNELAFHGSHLMSSDTTFKWALGLADQNMQAYYSHGYDYQSRDQIGSFRLEVSKILSEVWTLSMGAEAKVQTLRSNSEVLFNQLSLSNDHFNNQTYALFTQAVFAPETSSWEASLSARLNQINSYWIGLDRELQGQVLTPRAALKYKANDYVTHLLSAGMGYRVPLSLFESQHGTDHYGFIVDLNSIETSYNANYALVYQTDNQFLEMGFSYNLIKNMAYGEDRSLTQDPTRFVNATEAYGLTTIDTQYAHKFENQNEFEVRLEKFMMPMDYKLKLPVASIEERIQIKHTWKDKDSQWQVIANWVGARNLSEFAQYSRHYNQVSEVTDVGSPDFGNTIGIDQKPQSAPAFWTFDLNWSYDVSENLNLFFAVTNILDYTQTGAGDSPLTWHLHGQHYHLDNFHIWGPLRGREYQAQVKYSF